MGGDLKRPLRLAFEAREEEWVVWCVKTKNTPSDSHLKGGRGNRWWCGV